MIDAIQDCIHDNSCFGCGTLNELGLQIKSYWSGENQTICHFRPLPHHSSGSMKYLNGGIIATIIDCHCVCSAIAKGYLEEGRKVGDGDQIWYVTGTLEVKYLRPVPIHIEVILKAEIVKITKSKMEINCSLFSNGQECVEAKVVAVRVPNSWLS